MIRLERGPYGSNFLPGKMPKQKVRKCSTRNSIWKNMNNSNNAEKDFNTDQMNGACNTDQINSARAQIKEKIMFTWL